jgi:long-chain acyl-CoA synthetase
VLHKELDADDGEMTRTARSSAASSTTSTRCWSTRCTAARTEQFIETAVKFEDGRTGSVSATLKIIDAKTLPAVSGKAA